MKRKILFALFLAVFFTLVFVISANATVYYYEEGNSEAPMFQYETKVSNYDSKHILIDTYIGEFPKADANGNALTWYVTSTTQSGGNTIKTVKSVLTTDERYFTISSDGAYSYGGTAGTPVTQYNVVSVNFPQNGGIKTLNLQNDGYRVGNIYSYDYNSTEILFLYLPNTLTALNERIVQNTKVLVCDIPFEITAKEISHVAFYHAKNLREINIPITVKSINGKNEADGSAFLGCEQLVRVNFHKDSALESIGAYAFNKCDSLREVVFPDSLKDVGAYAFYLTGLTQSPFTMNSKATVGDSAFGQCTNLKNFIVPAGVTELNAMNMLFGCSEIQKIEFANNSQLQKISDNSFRATNNASFSKLKYIILPDSVTHVGNGAFYNVPIETNPFGVDSRCTYIGHAAFLGTRITEVNIPKNAQFNMGADGKLSKEGVFSHCSLLETVNFREDSTTTALPKYMFAYCSNLTYVKIPNSVTTMSIRTFDRCVSLHTVILGAKVEFMNWGRNDSGEDHASFFYNCLSLKNVYLPRTIDITRIERNQCHFFTTADSAIGGTYKKVAYFFDGTLEEAEALKAAFSTQVTSCGRNDRITSAEIISLAAFNEKFPDRTVDYDKNYIVYGVNTCDAFYNGVHDATDDGSCTTALTCKNCQITITPSYDSHNYETEIKYPKGYTQSGYIRNSCVRCSSYTEEALAPLFECLGYSTPESNKSGITIGFIVNNEAIEKYQSLTGKALKYGAFAVAQEKLGTNDIFGENDTVVNGAITAEITSYEFSSFDLKIVGFTDEYKDDKLALGAYIITNNGEANEYSYLQSGTPNENEKYCFVSYNDIIGKISTNEEVAQ